MPCIVDKFTQSAQDRLLWPGMTRVARLSHPGKGSHLARAPGAVRGKGFIRMRIKLAGARVPLDGGVELLRVECREPGAKPRQLARGKLFDGFFDVFGGGHVQTYSIDARTVKGRRAQQPTGRAKRAR